jgi:hypothetical protein
MSKKGKVWEGILYDADENKASIEVEVRPDGEIKILSFMENPYGDEDEEVIK